MVARHVGLRKGLTVTRSIRGVLTIVYAGFMLAWAIAPVSVPTLLIPFDRQQIILHFVEYVVFGLLLWWTFANLRWSIAAGSCYGVLLEVVQIWIHDRDFFLGDMAANVAGVIVGLVAARQLASMTASSANPKPFEAVRHGPGPLESSTHGWQPRAGGEPAKTTEVRSRKPPAP